MADLPVWFDLENTPHVLFLEPLLTRLQAGGTRVVVTARPQAQTLDLASERGLSLIPVGRGDLAGTAAKLTGALGRAAALARWAWGVRPALLVSSSRTASLAAWGLRIPALGLLDYEHAEHRALSLACETIWIPDLLRDAPLPGPTRRVARFYRGLKENLYLDNWKLVRAEERARLGVGGGTRLVVARPPADTAHYSSRDSMVAWHRALKAVSLRPDVRIMVVARTAPQREAVGRLLAGVASVTLVERTVSGPALLAAADLVVSGGGTMNREAAVLGVPAWSVFSGPTPHIDTCLAGEGRLRWVRSDAELQAALAAWPEPLHPPRGPFPEGLKAISDDIDRMLDRVVRSG